MVLETSASNFPFKATLEDNYSTIRREVDALMQYHPSRGGITGGINRNFQMWPQEGVYNRGWNLCGLLAGYTQDTYQRIEDNCALVPETVRILESIPGIHNAGFSVVNDGTYIRPHRGPVSIIRVHLGIIIPSNCAIRIAGETCYWQEGKVFPAFDDTVVHEAWNYGGGGAPRVILLMDFDAEKLPSNLTTTAARRGWKENLGEAFQSVRCNLYNASGIRPSGLVNVPHKITQKMAYALKSRQG